MTVPYDDEKGDGAVCSAPSTEGHSGFESETASTTNTNQNAGDRENILVSQVEEADPGIADRFVSVANDTSEADGGAPADAAMPETLTPKGILALRLPASALAGVETKNVRTRIAVDKPPKDQFFRVKEGPGYWIPFGVLQVERTSSFYLVAPGAARDWMLDTGIKSFYDCVLCLVVTRHGEPRVWPLKQTENPWHDSARGIAEMAKTQWVKLISDRAAGCYVAGVASNQEKPPVWPEESFDEILEKAFAGRIIDSLDHEVIKELSGDD